MITRTKRLVSMLESIKEHGALSRGMLGPLEELRRAGIFDVDPRWQQAMDDFHARFRLPEMTGTARRGG